MTVEGMRSKAAGIEALRLQTDALSLSAYVHPPRFGTLEPVFVADLDTAHPERSADRSFDLTSGLQSIFAQPIDLVEVEMFVEVEKRHGPMEPVSLGVLRAAA